MIKQFAWSFNAHPDITAYELANCLAITIQMNRGDVRDYHKDIHVCGVEKYFSLNEVPCAQENIQA